MLKAEWESYLRRVFDRPPSLVQQTETQRAFYAGAAALFQLVMQGTEGTEDEGEANLSALQGELQAFADRVGTPAELPPLPAGDRGAVRDQGRRHAGPACARSAIRFARGCRQGGRSRCSCSRSAKAGSMFYLSSAERTSMLEALHEFIARQIPSARGH